MTDYSKYEQMAGKVDEGSTFKRLCEHLQFAAEACYVLGHIRKWNGDEAIGAGFLVVGQMLEQLVTRVTSLAGRRVH